MRLFATDATKYCQFTGLRDKKGRDIYEGDILHITFGWDAEKGENFRESAVEFFQPWAMFACHGVSIRDLSLCLMEIIGNIYENPELLMK